MSYSKKTWTNRTSEYPNRYQMTSMNGNIADVAIVPKEGTITNEGDRFDADTMNDLETRIDNEFSSVESSMSAQDTTLRGLITAEKTRATGIENLLRTDVDRNTSGLASEITRATAKENEIADNLASEITRATGIESGLRTDVTSLQGRMTDTESDVDTLTSRISSLEQSVEIETDRAEDAEATLDTKIDGVASDLDAEVTRATSAENTITTNLTNEISRAQSVESALTTSINNEIARATQAESNLHDYVDEKVSTAYKASGSIYFADLPALTESRQGNVYNIKDDFTTTSDFAEGAGKSYPQGTNVAIVRIEEDGEIVYKYDVQAGFVDYSLFATQEEVNDISNVYGAKNLIPYPYYGGNSVTKNGITFTVNADKSITASGTATATAVYNIAVSNEICEIGKQYKINGCPSGGSGSTYMLETYESNASSQTVGIDFGAKPGGTLFTSEGKQQNVRIVIYPAAGEVSLTFYPMIRLKSIKDATWQPYAKTNRELTQQQYTFVGVCESAGSEQNKVVTVDEGFVLEKGVRIAIKFTKTNTFVESSSERITFNVNNTGAKRVNYGSGGAITWADGTAFGAANQYCFYIYDGTNWVWDGHNKDNNVSSVMSVSELKAGTSTSSKVVRADYLNQAITEMINEHGSSGHTIVDSNGTELTSRSKLKFLNATVTDDETNDQTIVTPEGGGGSEIPQFTLAEWDALTDAEKAQYDGKEFVITDDYDGEPIDSELSSESENPVQNKVVTKGINDVKDGVSDIVNVLGAKNLLPYPYVDGNNKSTEGVTFSVDNNGVIHANGTSTTYCSYNLANDRLPLKLNAGKYILSNSAPLPIYIYLGVWYSTISPSSNTNLAALRLSNIEQEFEITEEMAAKIENGEAYLLVRLASDSNQSGVTWDNMALYPMIRPKGIEDTTWQPYTKTNKELTEDVNNLLPIKPNFLSLGVVNQIPYPYYDGKSKTADGITWTVNNDKSITINGTATKVTYFYLVFHNINALTPNIPYAMSLGSDISTSKLRMQITYKAQGGSEKVVSSSSKAETNFTITDSNIVTIQFRLVVLNGQTIDNITVYPSIRELTDGKTNRQLTNDVDELNTKLNESVDTTPTPFSNNLVTSSGVASGIGSVIKMLGIKNLLPNNATSQTLNGVTFTVNDDGSITANGTATTTFLYYIKNDLSFLEYGVDYLLTGCPSSGSEDTYCLMLRYAGYDTGDGLVFNYRRGSTDLTGCDLSIRVMEGTTLSNITFKPMMCSVYTANDGTYEPYVMTNKELTEKQLLILQSDVVGVRFDARFKLVYPSDFGLEIPENYEVVTSQVAWDMGSNTMGNFKGAACTNFANASWIVTCENMTVNAYLQMRIVCRHI